MSNDETPVKASELIAKLKKDTYEADIVDSGDLYPYLKTVEVCVDEDTHVCSLMGYYAYHDDTVNRGVSPGESEAEVLGVVFSCEILRYDLEIKISGREIEYDNGLKESDVIAAAAESIEFPAYDPDSFPFEEDEVTDSDIIDCIECECEVFALNENDEVCGFDSEEEAEEAGCTVIDTDEAYARLASDRDIEYDVI